MKRYQCIKDFYMSDKAHQMPGELAFKAGKVYELIQEHPSGYLEFTSEISPHHTISQTTTKLHFQELLDLNVDDHEEEQYTAMFPKKNRLGIGCAIIIAVFLTVLALIFFR